MEDCPRRWQRSGGPLADERPDLQASLEIAFDRGKALRLPREHVDDEGVGVVVLIQMA